jgi:transcription initiation factor IIF auxiliary subunit
VNGSDINRFITKVVFLLHPSFNPPDKEVTSPPWKLVGRAWGTFDTKVTITWFNGKLQQFIYPLQFSESSRFLQYEVIQ